MPRGNVARKVAGVPLAGATVGCAGKPEQAEWLFGGATEELPGVGAVLLTSRKQRRSIPVGT